jgi:hypothetical protein
MRGRRRIMFSLERAIGMAWFALLGGCSLGGSPSAPCTAEGCFTEHYFGALSDTQSVACSPVTPSDRLGMSVGVSLFWGGGVEDGAIAARGSQLQRFFQPYALDFHTARGADDSHLAYAMRGSSAELDAALAQANIPTDRAPTSEELHRANRAVGPIIFADLRAFVLGHPQAHTVNMVVLEHVVAPELSAYLFNGSAANIIGFAISPALFAQVSASDPEYDLWEMTGVTGDFTPALFMGDADVHALPGSADNVIAHEMGHALGLPHSTQPANLMMPGQNRPCEEALSPDQLAEIRQDVSDQVPGSDAGSLDAASTTSIARRDVLPSVVSSIVRAWQLRQAPQRDVR